MKKLYTLFAGLFFVAANAQVNKQMIMLKSHSFEAPQDISIHINDEIPQHQIFNGYYYRLVHFTDVPTQVQKQDMQSHGVFLLDYIPYNTWFVAIPENLNRQLFIGWNATTLLPVQTEMIAHTRLMDRSFPAHSLQANNTIDLTIKYFENNSEAVVKQDLISDGAKIFSTFPQYHQMSFNFPLEKLNEIMSKPYISLIEPIAPPSTPDDTKGRSLHRSNAINTDYAAGAHFDGAGVSIALADDGEVGPHIDFQGRITNYISGSGGNHGDMTSGIAVGAGNLDPTIRGMGSGADIYVYDINAGSNGYDHIYNAPAHLPTDATVITSTSYSQGCNEYNAITQTGDQIVHDNPVLQLVFSAGNNNGADCGYGAGGNWGNITGGFKQGKNVIACANVDADAIIDPSSSHGPSADGRVKPDITSNGRDQESTDDFNTYQIGGGTSAACPGIAGINSQLYQAYKTFNGGTNPQSGLIKGALLNTADEIGNVGPDFIYGWGRVNALKAEQLLEQNRYLFDSITNGSTQLHNINIPAGVKQVKVMVYWTDVEGAPAAAITLVNDINITLTDPSSNAFNPWILDPSPNTAALNAPAVRGVDNRNNMEQVTIDDPAAGVYTVSVSGFNIPQGPQEYFLVWDFVMDEIKVTYPFGGEGFVPGESELIRWDAFETTGNFTVEYSTDNGTTWNNISSVASSLRQAYWSVPNSLTSDAKVRVSRGSLSGENSTPFTIISVPQNISFGYACPDTLMLSWNAVTGAIAYEVSMLGNKYMDSVATTTGTSILLAVQSSADTWFSVKAIHSDGGKGRRAIAIHKTPGLINCSLADDIGLVSQVSPAIGNLYPCTNLAQIPVTIQVQNQGVNTISNFTASYQLDTGTPVTENVSANISTGASYQHTFATFLDLSGGGNHTLTLTATISGDLNAQNNTVTSLENVQLALTAPITQDFQSTTFPPAGWDTLNSNFDFIWELQQGVIGSTGATTNAARFDNCGYNNRGVSDYLISPLTDLSALTQPYLTFDVSYQPYGTTYDDSLKIQVSTDCGLTWQQTAYSKGSVALATSASTTSCHAPASGAQWRNDNLNLTPYLGQPILFRFENVNDFGNYLYLDNINIVNGPVAVQEENVLAASVAVYPNPSNGTFTTQINNLKGKFDFAIYNMQGKLIQSGSEIANGNYTSTFDLSNESKGIYTLKISSENESALIKLVLF